MKKSTLVGAGALAGIVGFILAIFLGRKIAKDFRGFNFKKSLKESGEELLDRIRRFGGDRV